MHKHKKNLLAILIISAIILMVLYLFLWYFQYDGTIYVRSFKRIMTRKTMQLIALMIAVTAIATTSLVFQTVTNNRIMTPSVIGFDSIFILCQTTLIFYFGNQSVIYVNAYYNFLVTTIAMLAVSLLMYKLILRNNKNNIILLLLVGMIISTLSRSFTSFLQVIMNPGTLFSAISSTQASINNMNLNIMLIVIPILGIVTVSFFRRAHVYDVMTLNESHAINLGVSYYKETNIAMVYIAIGTALATALIGPITFLGLIAVNITRELYQTYKHRTLMIISSLVGLVIVLLGQLLIEQLNMGISIAVILNLIGGIYMIILILKVNKK